MARAFYFKDMKFLIDGSTARVLSRQGSWPDGFCGQLLTPLTRYSNFGGTFAIDNGAYSYFEEKAYFSLLLRESKNIKRLLFICLPDKVGSNYETDKLWEQWSSYFFNYPIAYVAQDGCQKIPENAKCLFVGGTTAFKESNLALELVEKALSRNLHVHIGRVNDIKRYLKFKKAGAHTCDGSGVSRFDSRWDQLKQNYIQSL